MTKQIRKLSSLPEWFDLSKYDKANSLDSSGWYEQLAVRQGLLSMIGSPRWDRCQNNSHKKIAQGTIRVLALVRDSPIVNVHENELLKIYFLGGAMHELKTLAPRYSLGVHLSTTRNLYITEGHIEKDKRAYARNFFAELLDDDIDWMTPLKYKCTDWIDEPVDSITTSSSSEVNVSVNLSLPDKLLIKQFSQMLQSLRNGMLSSGVAAPPTRKQEAKNWVRFSVLPYLDLQIWEREADVRISNRVMADAIFPPGEGGEEVVRKTTAEIARELVTRKSLESLAALAAYEIAERNDC